MIKNRHLCIFFPKKVHIEKILMKPNMTFFDKNKLLEKYNEILEKVINSINK